MKSNLKKYFARRAKQINLILSTEGSLQARLSGCYFEFYEMLNKLRLMGINPETIIDVGANRGVFTKTAHYVFPNAKIISFEPLKECYQVLKSLKNTIPTLECYNFALSNENGAKKIHHNKYDYSSSILEMTDLHKTAYPYTSENYIEEIKTIRLDDIIEINKIEKPNLMKIDVQGYEKYVLEGSVKVIENINYILCELSFQSLYEEQVLFDEIYTYLKEKGFKFLGPLSTNFNPITGEVMQIDGLFFNERGL